MKKILLVIGLLLSIASTSANARVVTLQEKIAGLYITIVNRAPDESGLNYWKTRAEGTLSRGESLSAVFKELASGFSKHPTFVSLYSELDNKPFVEAIYRNALGKEGDTGGVAYWSGELDKKMLRSDMLAIFVTIALEKDLTKENYPDLTDEEIAVAQQRKIIFRNKVQVALAFTNTLGDKTNVADPKDYKTDPAYLASIEIIADVTEDPATVSNALRYLESVKDENDPMANFLDTKPIITVLGNNPEIVLLNSEYTDAGATAEDTRDGTVEVTAESYVDTSWAGRSSVWYFAMDSAGNRAWGWRRVSIVDSLDFVAHDDEVLSTTIKPVTAHVLENDTIAEGSTAVVSLDYDWDGQFTVVGDAIMFTPDPSFNGGGIGNSYKITDQYGNRAEASLMIIYPTIFQAVTDFLYPSAIAPATAHVLDNDIFIEGSTVTVSLDGDGEVRGGTLTLAGDALTFTPKASFGGGWASGMYTLADQSGHESWGHVSIKYPEIFVAKYDHIEANTIEPVTVQVLENDTIPEGSTVTILLRIDYEGEYVTALDTVEGTWSVVGNSVRFTPNTSFGGGMAYGPYYQITDQDGYVSESLVTLEYPEIFVAKYDRVRQKTIEPITIDVLENDIIPEGSTVTLLLGSYGDEYATTLETSDGVWSIVGNSIRFVPNADFEGGMIYGTSYQITDQAGHISVNWIVVEYP